MIYWQLIGFNRQVWFKHPGVERNLMSAELSELDSLRSLDPKAITSIHNRYFPEVYRFARFRVSDEVTAEDIAGDVFMRLLEAVHNGRGPETNLRGWLLRTTANIVNDYFRKIYNRPSEASSEILENTNDLYLSQSDPVVLSDQAEQRRLIQFAMEHLTDAQKLVITLRFGNRFSLEETAKLMGKNANTIKALQYRALVALRRIIGNDTV
jgi:RNA polymerase sigma-70 factor (ECF subfamily)